MKRLLGALKWRCDAGTMRGISRLVDSEAGERPVVVLIEFVLHDGSQDPERGFFVLKLRIHIMSAGVNLACTIGIRAHCYFFEHLKKQQGGQKIHTLAIANCGIVRRIRN